ncbi:MAG: GNAT family N-acetyltransferase, partial [Steroidobacteraceae bacterium]
VKRHKGVRVLQWLGEQVTDYCDAVVDPHIDANVALERLWGELNDRGGFDIARLKHVRADAKVSEFIDRLHPWVETSGASYGIPIECATGKDWIQRLGARRRERVNYGLRRMARLGFEFWLWQPPAPLEPLIDTLLGQKRSWLASQGIGGVLEEAPATAFMCALATEMAGGGLHLSVIRSHDRIATCHLGFLRDGVLYSYMPSYDLSLQKYGFGTLLRETLIMWACDNGVRRLDLLLGDEEYKTQYDFTREPVRTLVIGRGLLGKAIVALYRLAAARARSRVVDRGAPREPGVTVAGEPSDALDN